MYVPVPVTLFGLLVSFCSSSLACMATSPVGADSPDEPAEQGPLPLRPSPVDAVAIRSSREVALRKYN